MNLRTSNALKTPDQSAVLSPELEKEPETQSESAYEPGSDSEDEATLAEKQKRMFKVH